MNLEPLTILLAFLVVGIGLAGLIMYLYRRNTRASNRRKHLQFMRLDIPLPPIAPPRSGKIPDLYDKR